MSERRRARGRTTSGQPRYHGNVLPPELAIGPCIEEWADRGRRTSGVPWHRARWNWAEAVDEWAVSTGWATEKRPASNARNLARTRLPWSRAWLLEQGRGDVVAWLEGRGPTPERGVYSALRPN